MYAGPATGIWSSPNQFSASPAGSLKTADNVVYTAPTVIEPRRGFYESGSYGTPTSVADAMAFYGSNLLVAYDLTKVSFGPVGEARFEWAETFAPAGANRLRFEAAARSVFFNPASGVRVFDGTSGFVTASAVVGATRALSYSGGAGDLVTSTEIVGTTSGASGVIWANLGQSIVASVVGFTAVSGGPFIAGEALTGDAGWTGVAVGADTPVIVIDDWSADVVARLNVAGASSGATGIVRAVVAATPVTGIALLALRSVTGTFTPPETIALGSSSLAPTMAGCPQGLNIAATNASGNGWMLPNTAVAYRFTVCRKDGFGRIIEGPPSGRTVLRNLITSAIGGGARVAGVVQFVANGGTSPHYLTTGDVVTLTPGETNFPAGAKTITVVDAYQFSYVEAGAQPVSTTLAQTFTITRSANLDLYFPADCTVANFLRVYRSEMTLAATDVPSDEMFQCYETAFLSDAELAAGVVEFQDVTPETILEVPLYTNPNTGDGSLSANYRPPVAEDLAYWQDRMWYLNSTDKHSAELSLIGVGSPDGLQDTDTLTIHFPVPESDLVYTAKVAPIGGGQFQLFTDADPAYNIQRTAQALCQVINNTATDLVYAFYVSSETGLPGKILLVARDFGEADSFELYSSRATCWTPQLPIPLVPPWEPLASSNNRHAARLWYSKLGQPEAVPLLNYIQIAADNSAALRCIPLQYRLIVFKEDGIYAIPNTLPVSQEKLSNHVLIAPDSCAKLGETLYALTDVGVIAIDDSGVRPVSSPIDDVLAALGGPASLDLLKERAVGVSYRTAREYLLWLIQKSDTGEFSTDNEQAYVLSTLANGYTRWTFGVRCGVVDTSTDKLIVAPVGSNQIWQERKTLTDADYVDPDGSPIATEIVFNALTDGEPAVMKLTQQCSFLFKSNGIGTVEALFGSELAPNLIAVALETPGWGEFSWGEWSWGGFVRAVRRVAPLPLESSNCCQLTVGFRTSQVGARYQFLGIDAVSRGDTVVNHG